MNDRRKTFLCLFVIGILCYVGILTKNSSKNRIRVSSGPYLTLVGHGLPNMNREPGYRHYTAERDELASESKGASSIGLIQHDTEEKEGRPFGENINVAVLTINPHWLFRLRLNQRAPLIYKCQHTRKTISVTSAYLNATLTRGADVVIFSRSIDHRLWDQVLAERSPHQVWVYGSGESAYKSPQVREEDRPVGFGNFRFNMSFSYHSRSDVVAPFGEYVPFKDASKKTKSLSLFSKLKEKTKLVAWVSSHCDMQQWDRVGFIQRLTEFLPIDRFGKCGNLTLPRGGESKILKSYKFYLALENSCCSEYVTEKFWQSLSSYEAVPVVIGAKREEYKSVAPPNSFIFAGDFDSMSDLADYLQKVASDDAVYGQFHEWRQKGEAKLYAAKRVYAITTQKSACALLEFLEKHAWKKSGPLEMSFDPYGPEWLGSCEVCSEKTWLKSFDLNSDAYNPTMREKTQRPEYKFKNKIEHHRQQIAREYMDQLRVPALL